MNKILIAASILFSVISCHGAEIINFRPTGPQPIIVSPQGRTVKLYAESHALLISESAYLGTGQQGWRPLDYAKAEVDSLVPELRRQGFHVRRVSDTTGVELNSVIREFVAEYGHIADSRILFLFSGHGYTNPKTNVGYIVPIDAKDPSRYPKDFYSKALPIQTLELIAREIESRHVMFVFDSCFSGSIFGNKAISSPLNNTGARWRFLSEQAQSPVRQFIAAGGADEVLPAKSVFIPMFLRALQGVGNSKDGYVTGRELGLWIAQTLPSFNKNQNPHSDVIKVVDLAFGDMVFQITESASQSNSANADLDRAKWEEARAANTAAAYKSYISSFPTGANVDLAKKFAIKLEPAPPPATTPLPNSVPTANSQSPTGKSMATRPAGYWVYLGVATGTRLSSKTFRSSELPISGEKIVAAVSVTKRAASPIFTGDVWELGAPNGVLTPNQIVKVIRLEKIESTVPGNDIVWAQVTAVPR